MFVVRRWCVLVVAACALVSITFVQGATATTCCSVSTRSRARPGGAARDV